MVTGIDAAQALFDKLLVYSTAGQLLPELLAGQAAGGQVSGERPLVSGGATLRRDRSMKGGTRNETSAPQEQGWRKKGMSLAQPLAPC